MAVEGPSVVAHRRCGIGVAAASNDDVDASVMEVAQAGLALDEIADRLRHLVG